MSVVIPMRSASESPTYRWRLVAIIEQLMELEGDMISAGLNDEADSLATVVADLHWQYQEQAGGTLAVAQ